MTTTRTLARTAGLAGLLLVAPSAGAAPEDRFHGGGFDGVALASYNSYTPPAPGGSGRFVGGGAGFDGYDGGSFTGYAPPAPGALARFTASAAGYDGYASGAYDGYTVPGPGSQSRFVGGGGWDGYASAVDTNYTPPAPGALGRFRGGGHDGFDLALGTGLPNPLLFDTDIDGVPDWWEILHYGNITLANATTDRDGDHKGSLDEFLADTDPNDGDSFFDILSFARQGGWVDLTCGITSPARRYWVESTNAPNGSWTTAPAPPVPGNGATLDFSLQDPWDDRGFFRVRVALPETE